MQNWTREQHHPFNIFRSRNIFLEFILHAEHCSALASQIFLASKDRNISRFSFTIYLIEDSKKRDWNSTYDTFHHVLITNKLHDIARFKEVKSKIKYQIFISSYIPIKLIYCKFFNKNLSPIYSQRSKILVRSRRQSWEDGYKYSVRKVQQKNSS